MSRSGAAVRQRGGWPRRRVVGVGLAGVLLTFAVLATLQVFTIHPFHPVDEMSHVGYALTVGRGDLPTLDTPIPGGEIAQLQHRVNNSKPANRTIWTAHHPPLYYVVAAVPLRLGVDSGHALGGIRAARLVNVGFSLAGLVLVALLARELVPGRPEVWVGAAGLAALVPGLVQTSAIVYNDALMFAVAAASLVLVARALRRGLTPRRLVLLSALGAVAALVRASGLLVVVVAVCAAGTAVWLHERRPAPVRALLATGAAGAVGLAAAVAAGWFYLRNQALYGSFTGTAAVLAKFHRGVRGTIPGALVDPDFWTGQLRRLWDDSAGPSGRNGVTRYWYLTFVPAIGLVLAGIRWLRRAAPPRAPQLLAWAACLGLAALVELSAASFYSVGGSAHGRYMLPGLSVLAVAAAVGMAGLPGGRRAVPTIAMLPVLVVVNVMVWQRYLRLTLRPAEGESVIGTALRSAHVPGWVLVPAAVLLCAGLAAQVWALWTLSARRSRPVPAATAVARPLEYAGG